ncbi:MAG: hypothetical protein HQL27_07685 [Candidatus Omnitrophica bacterium]|nr:hypothetical protein [Candidatus Omnitrophota bacterium]
MSRKANTLYKLIFFLAIFSSFSCSGPVSIQPQVNSLAIAGKNRFAIKVLEENKDVYGKKNRLLYLMDYGFILHISGEYKKSIEAFEEAKRLYSELYTKSISNYASTWIVNDNNSFYRGEDFERVMINIFQAVNFLMLGDLEEALVEARNVDNELKLINDKYPTEKKNVYSEDAFARFFMGIVYESSENAADFNNAYVSYKKALSIYENNYSPNYGVSAPHVLKDNWAGLAEMFDKGNAAFFEDKRRKGEVYLIDYYGLSPVKHEKFIPVPDLQGRIFKFAFPSYDKRTNEESVRILSALSEDSREFSATAEIGEDISAIAVKNLENRKARFVAKSVFRSAAKFAAEYSIDKQISAEYGDNAADLSKYLANLYNLSSEQADLRSWQTLPAQIRIARLILEPGKYKIYFGGEFLGTAELSSGDKKFFVLRTVR